MNMEHDHLEIRCPMLGHPLNFSYCRSANSGEPCRKIFDCWFTRIDIKKFVNENFSNETISKLSAPPKPKVLSILEIAQQAMAAQKQRNADTSES